VGAVSESVDVSTLCRRWEKYVKSESVDTSTLCRKVSKSESVDTSTLYRRWGQ